jgi:hydroxylamine reductase (hybrid-cluster protein)
LQLFGKLLLIQKFNLSDVKYRSDGGVKNREYYTEFAQVLPKDTIILTAGCAKYKYNKFTLGDVRGIPGVLDAGCCSDSYSLAVIALLALLYL